MLSQAQDYVPDTAMDKSPKMPYIAENFQKVESEMKVDDVDQEMSVEISREEEQTTLLFDKEKMASQLTLLKNKTARQLSVVSEEDKIMTPSHSERDADM